MEAKAAVTARPSSDDLLTSAQVRATCGNISEMSLWRWTRTLGFPKPDRVINRRKFWRRSTVEAWKARDTSSGTDGQAA